MSVAFFLLAPCAGAKMRSIEDSEERDDVLRVAAPVRVRALYCNLAPDDFRLEQAFQLGFGVRADRHRQRCRSRSSARHWVRGRGVLCAGRGKMIVSLLLCHN